MQDPHSATKDVVRQPFDCIWRERHHRLVSRGICEVLCCAGTGAFDPNRPASESGLTVGDLITEVGGRKAISLDLSRI